MSEKSTDEILRYCELCNTAWEKLSYNARARLKNKYYEYYYGIPSYGKKRALCPMCEEKISLKHLNEFDDEKVENMVVNVNYSGGMREQFEIEMIVLLEKYGYSLHKNKYSDDMKNKSLIFSISSKRIFNNKCVSEDC